MAAALDVAAIVSALGAGLGCASVSARILFALGRDRRLPSRLAAISPATGAPAAGLAFVMGLDLVLIVVLAALGKEAMDVLFYLATIGTLSLLAMYVMRNFAALRFLRTGRARGELLLPAAGIAVAVYVLYHNKGQSRTRRSTSSHTSSAPGSDRRGDVPRVPLSGRAGRSGRPRIDLSHRCTTTKGAVT